MPAADVDSDAVAVSLAYARCATFSLIAERTSKFSASEREWRAYCGRSFRDTHYRCRFAGPRARSRYSFEREPLMS